MMSDKSEKHTAEHVLPLKLYMGVGAALLVFTVITVAVSFVDFGGFNLVVAMLIATIKASLVALFFMHLLYDNKFFLTIFIIALVFVAIFIILTMFDTLQRDAIDTIKGKPIIEEARIYRDTAATVNEDTTAIMTEDTTTSGAEQAKED